MLSTRVICTLALAGTSVLGESNVSVESARLVSSWLDGHIAQLVETYKHIHANPELSLDEGKTAALLADGLRQSGYAVSTGVGGHGVVGVLQNGSGPTVLIRGDMDALPIIEETGLPYASEVQLTRPDGSKVGAMHACGHDVHTTGLLGTAQLLSGFKSHWQGTVVIVGQPAEEIGRGARMMLDGGLEERIPKPDYCIALHVKHDLPTGTIGLTGGWAFANVDSVDITIYGVGGHGARPHQAIDPVVTAAHVVTALQTLVSRRVDPIERAVVTVGSIHGGSKHNIIPNEVELQLTVRSYTAEVRSRLLNGIRQITEDVCKTFKCPRPPKVEVLDEHTPSSYNDPELTAAAREVFEQIFGEENVTSNPPEMGGEDFGMFSRHFKVPGLQYRIGSVSREAYEASLKPGAEPLPPVHSSRYAPVPEPTVRTAVRSLVHLALALLSEDRAASR